MLISKKKMSVITLQLPTKKRYKKNLDTLLSYIERDRGKDIILAPEVYLTGYDYEHLSTAAKFSAKALKILKKVIYDEILVLTLVVKIDDKFVNRAVVIHKHKVVHTQDKTQLLKLGDEELYFETGKKKKIMPFEIDGVRYAIIICFELKFKDLWKQIESADIVLIPSRWNLAKKRHLEVLSQALAIMNQSYVVVSNSSDKDMASSSSVTSPDGTVCKDDNSLHIESTIDFTELKKTHS